MSGRGKKLDGGAGWGLTRECPGCGRAETACRCTAPAAAPPLERQTARLRLERRCGKSVTVVAGLSLDAAGFKELLRELKGRCGAGGALKGGELEIQGDQRETVREFLAVRGISCKGG